MKLRTLFTAIIISITLSSCCSALEYMGWVKNSPQKNNKITNQPIATPASLESAAE